MLRLAAGRLSGSDPDGDQISFAWTDNGAQIAASAGLSDPNLPRLNIALLPGAVQLRWTTNAAGYLLETNGTLPEEPFSIIYLPLLLAALALL